MPLEIVAFLAVGALTGALSGLIGIGGGVLLTPALIYLFGFSQHNAQGTTLALLVPPISLLAAWAYYDRGYVDLKVAGLICVGFFIGSLLGAKFAVGLPDIILKRVFGAAMFLVATKMMFSS